MIGNNKSFNLITRTRKTFSLILSSFDYAVTFFFRINGKIKLTFVSTAIMQFVSTINLKRIRMTISQMKLITKITQTINLKRIRLVIVIRERLNAVAVFNQKTRLSFISKAIQKVVSIIILKKIKLTFVPTLATFFSLGYYDPQTLLTMDTQTLGSLDYIIA